MPLKKDHEQNEPRYLIIPAAGLGTRMREVNPDLPKEMLPIGNKPAIQYAVEEGLSAGIKNIIIIISRQKDIIRKYFENRTVLNYGGSTSIVGEETLNTFRRKCSFTFLYQEEPLGEADAISCAKDVVGSHSVAVIYPDNIYLPAAGALKALVSVYRKYGSDVIALNEVTDEISHSIGNAGRVDIGRVEDDLYRIDKFHPKTRDHFVPRQKGELRSCGIYISGPDLFDYIERVRHTVKEGELTDTPVRSLVLKERGILGFRLPGTVLDVGNPEGYNRCVKYISNMKRNN